jgi:hypothetical protein
MSLTGHTELGRFGRDDDPSDSTPEAYPLLRRSHCSGTLSENAGADVWTHDGDGAAASHEAGSAGLQEAFANLDVLINKGIIGDEEELQRKLFIHQFVNLQPKVRDDYDSDDDSAFLPCVEGFQIVWDCLRRMVRIISEYWVIFRRRLRPV